LLYEAREGNAAALDRILPLLYDDLRFFGGMADGEIAAALGVTDRTVRREWVKARAWLNRILYAPTTGGDVPAFVTDHGALHRLSPRRRA
jgi:hypothetical protein